MTCVAMGYPDDSFHTNDVRSDRQQNEDFVRYLGFGEERPMQGATGVSG
jgi:hypothetical protein